MSECCVEDFSTDPESEVLKDLLLRRQENIEACAESEPSERSISFVFGDSPKIEVMGPIYYQICPVEARQFS